MSNVKAIRANTDTDWRLEVKLVSHIALAQIMTHREFSVRKLADRTGIDRSTIGHLRSGHRTTCKPETARAIAKALDLPVDALFAPRLLHDARTSHGRRAA